MLGVCAYEEALAAIGAEIDRRGFPGFILREEATFVMVTPLRKAEIGLQSLRIETGDLGSLVSHWRSVEREADADSWEARLRRTGAELDAGGAARPVIKLQQDGGYASYRPAGELPVRLNYRYR